MNRTFNLSRILFLTVAMNLFLFGSTHAQLIVDGTYTPTMLVNNVLLGAGVKTSNIQSNCPLDAYGYFNGTASNIGLTSGVLLTTGDIINAVGPNLWDDATTANFINYLDPQLGSIEPLAEWDPCILEFDFIPDSSHVEFKYVFGSEEYNEYVQSGVNDVFGFFLTGPGIGNPNNNIATIPGKTTPICIDSVNNGFDFFCPSTGPCENCAYYFDNCFGATVEYDGFTSVLKASANVTKGLTYHIKLAIADGGDDEYDSGVFLEAGSFSSTTGGPKAVFNSSDTTFCDESGKCIDFYDHSTGSPSNWKWSFPGAQPDTSTMQNPTNICYYVPGTYQVTLTVGNSNGTDSMKVPSLIIFRSGATTPVIVMSHDTLFSSHAAYYQWYLNGSPISSATDSFYVASQAGSYNVYITDENGCSRLGNAILFDVVNELTNSDGFMIFPNPAKDQFTVYGSQFTAAASLELYDVLGKTVYSDQFTGKEKTINCKLASGVYFLNIRSESRVITKKLVIQKQE